MFRAWCKKWEREVLIWASSLEGITNNDWGIVVTYKCACGDQAEMVTGSAAPRELTVHARP